MVLSFLNVACITYISKKNRYYVQMYKKNLNKEAKSNNNVLLSAKKILLSAVIPKHVNVTHNVWLAAGGAVLCRTT